jgi:hypothetical protein
VTRANRHFLPGYAPPGHRVGPRQLLDLSIAYGGSRVQGVNQRSQFQPFQSFHRFAQFQSFKPFNRYARFKASRRFNVQCSKVQQKATSKSQELTEREIVAGICIGFSKPRSGSVSAS